MKQDLKISTRVIGRAPAPDLDTPALDVGADRSLWRAVRRGAVRRCPNCGGGPMMQGYVTVRHACAACGEELHHHRADDLPAWATILIVGHILGTLLLAVENAFSPPLWVHYAIWPALTLGLTVWLLPRVKGAIVGMQWAWRMHGFGDSD